MTNVTAFQKTSSMQVIVDKNDDDSGLVTNVVPSATTKATYDLGVFGSYETFDPSDGYQLCWGPYVPLGRFNIRGPYAFFFSDEQKAEDTAWEQNQDTMYTSDRLGFELDFLKGDNYDYVSHAQKQEQTLRRLLLEESNIIEHYTAYSYSEKDIEASLSFIARVRQDLQCNTQVMRKISTGS